MIDYWNALPQLAVDAENINQFKHQLNIHLHNIIRGLNKPSAVFCLSPTPHYTEEWYTVNMVVGCPGHLPFYPPIYYITICDLRAKVLVACLVTCLVTPALWLNLSDSRNILIIHFGLLLKERTLDSIGHDLWKKYNVICLLWMIHYISLLTNIFTQWILIDA